MKLEILAELLEKPASELQADLKLEEGAEVVPDNIAKSAIIDYGKGQFSKGKEQGLGWAKKEVLKDVEKKLGEKLGETGNFDDLLTKVGQPAKDNIWKDKFSALNDEFANFKLDIDKQKKLSTIEGKISTMLDAFDGSEKLKKLATKEFISTNKFEIEDDYITILDNENKPLKKDGKFVEFDNLVEGHFSNLFEKKTKTTSPSGAGSQNNNSSNSGVNTIAEAFKALKLAKTADERSLIQKRIKELEKI